MKVYVVYQSLYGDLLQETGMCTEIISVYENLEKAKEKVKQLVSAELANTENQKEGYVLDEEIEKDDETFFRFFWNKQENWMNYYEIGIEEREVE